MPLQPAGQLAKLFLEQHLSSNSPVVLSGNGMLAAELVVLEAD